MSIDHILTLFFGLTTIVTSIIALRYNRIEQRRKVEEIIDNGRPAALLLSREAMNKYMLSMYDRAGKNDVIWGQCISCAGYGPDVRDQVMKAAGRGVKFQFILNQYSPSLSHLRELFAPLEKATLIERGDNILSVQGLSDREIVIGFYDVEGKTAILVRDPYFVRIIQQWFENRLQSQKKRVFLIEENGIGGVGED